MNATIAQIKPEAGELRSRVAELINGGMSQTELARLAGTSGSTVGRWLAGKYEGDNSKIERQLGAALDSIADRKAANDALPAAPDYIATPTADRVADTLSYAHTASDVVVIYGGAGVGKTEAVRAYATRSPNVWISTATPASSSVVAALEDVADALGVQAPNGAARLHRAVVKRMRGTFGLLIIDEAQNLDTKALDQMRSIHDATGCGLALVGNEQVYGSMTGGNRAPYLDRLFSRVGQRLRLGKASNGDTDAIIQAWGVDAKDCIKSLRQIASTPGGLRSLTKTLRLASMYASADEREVCCSDIRAAWKRLGGAA